MKTVVLNAPTTTMSGYAVHSRQVARWLLSRSDLDVRFMLTPWGDTPWYVNGDACNGLIGEVTKRSVPPTFKADVSIQLKLPNEWEKLSPVNVGITAAVETDRCHPSWIAACNSMDAVIVPSQHAKLSLTNVGAVTVPLHVIPESYCDAIVAADLPPMAPFATPFNFLVFGQITGNNVDNDRKNTFYAVKWLCEAFKDDKDVGIVLKTNAGRNSLIDRNIVTKMFQSFLSEVRKGPYPKVYLVHGEMTDPEVASLYRHPQVKALVALTRGEGYGLPILEAAASGLPVIATGWSGHTDFLNHGKYISVYYQLADVHKSRIDNRIFVPGARWANPSEDDFKKKALKFRSSPATPKEWAVDLQAKIQELYAFDRISSMYDTALEGIV